MEKYFMHRIQEENGAYTKGIEIHDTLDAAILSFWGRMKLAYGASGITFMSCKITDSNGSVLRPYDLTWLADPTEEDAYFLHHIRLDGETFTKDIDTCASYETACAAYASQMEYGYNNSKHPNVKFVSCEVVNKRGEVMEPFNGTWAKPEEEPEQNQEN